MNRGHSRDMDRIATPSTFSIRTDQNRSRLPDCRIQIARKTKFRCRAEKSRTGTPHEESPGS